MCFKPTSISLFCNHLSSLVYEFHDRFLDSCLLSYWTDSQSDDLLLQYGIQVNLIHSLIVCIEPKSLRNYHPQNVHRHKEWERQTLWTPRLDSPFRTVNISFGLFLSSTPLDSLFRAVDLSLRSSLFSTCMNGLVDVHCTLASPLQIVNLSFWWCSLNTFSKTKDGIHPVVVDHLRAVVHNSPYTDSAMPGFTDNNNDVCTMTETSAILWWHWQQRHCAQTTGFVVRLLSGIVGFKVKASDSLL